MKQIPIRFVAPWQLLWLAGLGCDGKKPGGHSATDDSAPVTDDSGPDSGGPSDPVEAVVEGSVTDGGLGYAVLIDEAGTVFASAPFGASGFVYAIEHTTAGEVASGPTGLGASLAVSGGNLLLGDPLSGAVHDADGAVVADGLPGLGLALLGDSDGWVAAHGAGTLDSGGATLDIEVRPTSLARLDGVVVGAARGEHAVIYGQEMLSRTATDELGFSLASTDDRLVVGAPAGSYVVVLDAQLKELARIEGEGRFGAAVVVADHDGDGAPDLLIGAPMADEARGEVTLHLGPDWTDEADETWQGEEIGDELGFSVALAPGVLAAGAPGSAGATGSVLVVRQGNEG